MSDLNNVAERLERISRESGEMAQQAALLAQQQSHGVDPFIFGLTVFVLACFVGYYVVWKVTPALHTPLMAVTNAISSIIIVGALIAVGPDGFGTSQWVGFFAVVLASINIFGGFVVTQRMLEMFKKKEAKPAKEGK